MSIAISKLATDKLMLHPKLLDWRAGALGRKVPFLGYFRRCYSTLRDGTVVEHGDGFMLTSLDPNDDQETKDILIRSVPIVEGLDILVGGDEEIMSRNFIIGWSDWTFTYEPFENLDKAQPVIAKSETAS